MFTITRQWLTQSTPLRSPRRSQAQSNKGRGILGRSSKRRLFCLKQGNNVRSGLKLRHLIFFIRTSPPPPPLWKAILCSFCCRHHWRMHSRGPKWGSGWGDSNLSCQLTPSRPSKMLSGLRKDRGRILLLIGFGEEGGGGRGGRGENGISNLIFSPPPFFTLTITPLKLPKK